MLWGPRWGGESVCTQRKRVVRHHLNYLQCTTTAANKTYLTPDIFPQFGRTIIKSSNTYFEILPRTFSVQKTVSDASKSGSDSIQVSLGRSSSRRSLGNRKAEDSSIKDQAQSRIQPHQNHNSLLWLGWQILSLWPIAVRFTVTGD